MKKIISILSVACLTCLAGCETTATLDGGVDQRVTEVINGYVETMAGAENGWIFDVMSNEGNYRFYMDFTADNHVTMYTDNLYYPELNGVPQTSTYNVRSLQRPVISFDTYNYIHIINDPDDGISGGTGPNQGLESDFEFEVDHLTDGVFYLTGRKNRVEARMRPASAEEVVAVKDGGLMKALNNVADYHKEEYCYIMMGDTKVDVRFATRSTTLIYLDQSGNVKMASGNTRTELDNSFEMFKPLTVAGKQLTGFEWDEATKSYSAIVDGTRVLVEAGPEAAVELYNAFGENKTYQTMASLLSMYPSTSSSENYFGYAFEKDDKLILDRFSVQSGVDQVNLSFYHKEEAKEGEKERMLLQIVFGGGYVASFTYYLTYDVDDPSQFKVTKMTQEDDGAGNAETLTRNGVTTLSGFWVGKTFKLDWSKIKFGSYFMGQIEQVGGSAPAVFYGALLE